MKRLWSGSIFVLSFSLFFASVFTTPVAAQETILLQKTWGGKGIDFGRGTAVDSLGNIYVVGYTYSYGNGSTDICLLKYDSDGSLVWQRTWGGPGVDIGNGVAVDASGDIYVVGSTDINDPNYNDVLVLKFDASGGLVWELTWGSTQLGDGSSGIIIDASGDIYVTGTCGSTNFATSADVFLLKLNSTGDLLWQRFWDSYGNDGGSALTLDSQGNIYIAGITGYIYNIGGGTALILKINSSGELVWQRVWGGTNIVSSGSGVAADSFGNVYMTGSTAAFGSGDNDAFLLKFNSTGGLVWEKTFPGSGNNPTQGITVDSSGYVYIVGTSAGVFLLELNASGGLSWQAVWGSNYAQGSAIVSDSSGGLLVTGNVWGPPPYNFSALNLTVEQPTISPQDPSGRFISNPSLGSPAIGLPNGVVSAPSGSESYSGQADAFILKSSPNPIPEFPTAIVLPLFIVLTTLAIVLTRRIFKKPKT